MRCSRGEHVPPKSSVGYPVLGYFQGFPVIPPDAFLALPGAVRGGRREHVLLRRQRRRALFPLREGLRGPNRARFWPAQSRAAPDNSRPLGRRRRRATTRRRRPDRRYRAILHGTRGCGCPGSREIEACPPELCQVKLEIWRFRTVHSIVNS